MKDQFKLMNYPIFQKGYGLASKIILCDPGVPIVAKGNYCYLCSLSNSQNEVVYPSIFKIMGDLDISKDRYYKARKALLEAGIITIKRQKQNGAFDRNYYEFHLQPSRYMAAHEEDPYLKEARWEVLQYGVMQNYGLCPYAVMSDSSLNLEAKVVFAYISAHINISANPYAELDPLLIQYHLGMGINTYRKYVKELKDRHLIIVERIREKGSFQQTNRYSINFSMVKQPNEDVSDTVLDFPEDAETPAHKKQETVEAPAHKKQETVEAPAHKKQETVEAPAHKKQETAEAPAHKKQETAEAPAHKKQETVEAPTHNNPEMVKPETKNQETTITSFTITSSKQIFIDRWIDTIRKKIEYRVICFVAEDYPQLKQAADILVETVVETMTSPNHTTIINGGPVLTEYVRNVLMQVNNNTAMVVLNRCLSKQDKIRNMKAYLLTSLYNEIECPTEEVEEGPYVERF